MSHRPINLKARLETLLIILRARRLNRVHRLGLIVYK